MKNQYDDDGQECQNIGLGHRRNHKMTKNQQIYGDFYQAYEQQNHMNIKTSYSSYNKSAYNNFKIGSSIQNYSAECDIFILEPKKKIKKNQEIIQDQDQQPNIVGQFNLKSFLQQIQQKQIQQIQEQDEQQSITGSLCLNQNIKKIFKLVKLGEQSDQQPDLNDINSMNFQQYQKLVMRKNKNQSKQQKKIKLTPEQKQKQKQFIQGYGVGYKMLSKMGFNLSKGLGKQQKGIQKPVQAVFKTKFTTKDSQFKQQQKKDSSQKKEQQQNPAEQQIFQYRSKNKNINNFLIDLKNKFESLKSKIYFYERQVQNFNRDFQINNSLKLQKQNQIQIQDQQLHKLNSLLNYGKIFLQNHHGDKIKNLYPHLSLQYQMDILYLKSSYLKLKQMKDNQIYDRFPYIIKQIKQFLFNLYLQKQRQNIKNYKQGIKNLKDKNLKVINLEQDQIDIVGQGPTQEQSVIVLSYEDQSKIIKMIELIAQNTIIPKIYSILAQTKHIGQIKNYKILQCLRALKQNNKKSPLIDKIIQDKIKPLIFRYYDNLQNQLSKYLQKDEVNENQKEKYLPHLIIFPLFQILQPNQMQINRLLKILSKKIWSIKNMKLITILKPLFQFCSNDQRDHFINFYLLPRMLYQLQQFDLTQPSICKQLMTGFKNCKQFLKNDTIKDLLDHTIIPELIMTYKKYDEQGMNKQDLNLWIKRWTKQINKLAPHYLEETFFNDFHIQI